MAIAGRVPSLAPVSLVNSRRCDEIRVESLRFRCCNNRGLVLGSEGRLGGDRRWLEFRWRRGRRFPWTAVRAAGTTDNKERKRLGTADNKERKRPGTADNKERKKTGLDKAKEFFSRETQVERRKRVSTSNRRMSTSNRARNGKQKGRRSGWKWPNFAEELRSFMGPREKGDMRDLILMSFSFAVLIYISQHLVHAYFVLRKMYR